MTELKENGFWITKDGVKSTDLKPKRKLLRRGTRSARTSPGATA